ncbi:hypothetical protein D9M68_996010 [compost metagenome]
MPSSTFSRAVRHGSRRSVWKLTDILPRSDWNSFEGSKPATFTSPSSQEMLPISRLITVLLPAPVRPSSATISPLRTSMFRLSTARWAPKRLETFFSSSRLVD